MKRWLNRIICLILFLFFLLFIAIIFVYILSFFYMPAECYLDSRQSFSSPDHAWTTVVENHKCEEGLGDVPADWSEVYLVTERPVPLQVIPILTAEEDPLKTRSDRLPGVLDNRMRRRRLACAIPLHGVAFLSGSHTPSLQAQGRQRRSSYFNIPRDIPPSGSFGTCRPKATARQSSSHPNVDSRRRLRRPAGCPAPTRTILNELLRQA